MGDPKFCWRRPTSAQLLVGCPSLAGGTSLLLETPLLWGRPSTAGNVSLLPETPLFFLWGACFFLGRGDPLLLGTGHTSPFTGTPPLCWVALPLSSGAPLLVEYTPFLFVMGRPSSTGAPICCWGVCLLPDIVNGAPISCLAGPTSAGGCLFLINFCCGASLLLGRPSSAWGARLLLETPLFCWGAPLLPVAPIFLLWGSFFAGAPSCCQGAPLLGMGAPLSFCWGVAPLQGDTSPAKGALPLPGAPLLNRRYFIFL